MINLSEVFQYILVNCFKNNFGKQFYTISFLQWLENKLSVALNMRIKIRSNL